MKINNTIKMLKKSILLLLFCLLPGILTKVRAQTDPQKITKETFKGKISLDIRDSKEDWSPYYDIR